MIKKNKKIYTNKKNSRNKLRVIFIEINVVAYV